MTQSHGYDYRTRPNGEVHVFHQGKMVKLLRGEDAAAVLKALETGDQATVLADAVGATGAARPSAGASGGGAHLHGNGAAHVQQQFRRKSGSA